MCAFERAARLACNRLNQCWRAILPQILYAAKQQGGAEYVSLSFTLWRLGEGGGSGVRIAPATLSSFV